MLRNCILLTVAAVLFALSASASADLLVYEPFAYADGNLTGQGGALGTTGTWTSHDTLQAGWPIPTTGWWVHPEGDISGVDLSVSNTSVDPDGLNPFDGTVANLVTSGGYVGIPGPDNVGDTDPTAGEPARHMDASIGLHPSVTATFQSNTTTWFSFVSVRGWDRNEASPQFMIGTDPTPNNARGDKMLNDPILDQIGNGIGAGGGPPRNNLFDIYPQFFRDGVNNHTPGGYLGGVFGGHDGESDGFGGQTTDGALDGATQTMPWVANDADGYFGAPNIVVGKIQWDADTNGEDIISVVRFLETETLDEAAFDALILAKPALSSANWVSNKPSLDQTQFDTLNFSGTKYFVDEIRIATTLDEALGFATGPDPLSWQAATSGNWADPMWTTMPGTPENLVPTDRTAMTIDQADTVVTVNSAVSAAASVDVGASTNAQLVVANTFALEVIGAVDVGADGTLTVNGTLTAASVVCDGTLRH